MTRLSCLLVSVCLSCLLMVAPVWGQTDPTWKASIDRTSARSARVRFYTVSANTITATIVQYTNGSLFSTYTTLKGFHDYVVAGPLLGDDREVTLAQVGSTPITSYVLKNLIPSNTYNVRVGAFTVTTNQDNSITTTYTPSNPQAYSFTTPALSTNTLLSSLLVSGGCGQLTSTGALYGLNTTTDTSTGVSITVYSCDVVSEITNVTLAIVPQHAYATISSTQVPPSLTSASLALTVNSVYADPLTQYHATLTLNGVSSYTNYTWNVTSESGAVQAYMLSVRRAAPLQTAKIAGPSSPVVAMIRSPAVTTSLQFLGLTWSATTISKWKVWSDDLVTFPYSAFTWSNGAFSSSTSNTLLVNPTTASVPDGSCSNVYVALFDQLGNSFTTTTCISALDDYCSSTPFGAATTWLNPWANVATRTLPSGSSAALYFPAPPIPTFPAA